ncbi:hypothetical protein CEXT_323341 [Caerostris extrusa]|uniref:Uncharacterized protein n=1 Tax=Caerostris extrusa TaxID=172846 RepID=A0AAV4S9L5_CAEEX|nr:hypothetical protein CEXT_323341 [Caerostris extrusa]
MSINGLWTSDFLKKKGKLNQKVGELLLVRDSPHSTSPPTWTREMKKLIPPEHEYLCLEHQFRVLTTRRPNINAELTPAPRQRDVFVGERHGAAFSETPAPCMPWEAERAAA